MASQKTNQTSKRRRNRKARTEVSSDDSSSSDSERESLPAQKQKESQAKQPPVEEVDQASESPPAPVAQPRMSAQQSFEQFYLSQATKEFANDLDKLRNASDFRGGQSVELLVRGLKQGTACFGEGERLKVGGAGG